MHLVFDLLCKETSCYSHELCYDMIVLYFTFLFQYLGNDLEDVTGRTIHEPEAVITLPLIRIPGVVLIPGQTIPLQLHQIHDVAMMQKVCADNTDKTFGIMASTRLVRS